MKRTLSFVGCLVVAVVLVGCSPSSIKAPEAAVTDAGGVSLDSRPHLLHWYTGRLRSGSRIAGSSPWFR
jgi:hypothetical protein